MRQTKSSSDEGVVCSAADTDRHGLLGGMVRSSALQTSKCLQKHHYERLAFTTPWSPLGLDSVTTSFFLSLRPVCLPHVPAIPYDTCAGMAVSWGGRR